MCESRNKSELGEGEREGERKKERERERERFSVNLLSQSEIN